MPLYRSNGNFVLLDSNGIFYLISNGFNYFEVKCFKKNKRIF